MKWYWRVITYLAVLAVGLAAGWFVEFYNSPLGEPFCVARGADLIAPLLRELAADYRLFWIAICLVVGAIGVWMAIELHRIAEKL